MATPVPDAQQGIVLLHGVGAELGALFVTATSAEEVVLPLASLRFAPSGYGFLAFGAGGKKWLKDALAHRVGEQEGKRFVKFMKGEGQGMQFVDDLAKQVEKRYVSDGRIEDCEQALRLEAKAMTPFLLQGGCMAIYWQLRDFQDLYLASGA